MSAREFTVRDGSRATLDGLERVDFAVLVPADLCYFEGHFVDEPVLPGVAQLNNLVLPLVHRTWPAMPPLRRALKLKFHKAVRPGDALALRLERAAEHPTVSFVITLDGAVASAGTLHFGEASP